MAVLGAPVPPAFCVTTLAYQELARQLSLPERASSVSDRELAGIRATIERVTLSANISQAIFNSFRLLQDRIGGACPVAVRSSATAEDSAEFSFAGLHDTILDVREPSDVERAVKQCWASLWSERGVTYRRSGGPGMDDASMAVVVQQLVSSDVSFVVFTADPVGNRSDHLIISATYGLGEAVVSGLVTPDHIVIDVAGEVESYQVGEKEVMIIPGEHAGEGVRTVPVPRMLGRMPALSNELAREIGRLARGLEGGLGFPADFEGGVKEGKVYFFQARPITTLGAGPGTVGHGSAQAANPFQIS